MKAGAFARVLLTAIGVYAIVKAVESLQYFTIMVSHSPFTVDGEPSRLLPMLASLVVPVALAILGGILIFRPPRRLLPADDEEVDSPGACRTILKAGSFLIGVLVLADALPDVVNMIVSFSWKGEFLRSEMLRSAWLRLISLAVRLLIGVYLLIGAPQLVRWHMRHMQEEKLP